MAGGDTVLGTLRLAIPALSPSCLWEACRGGEAPQRNLEAMPILRMSPQAPRRRRSPRDL